MKIQEVTVRDICISPDSFKLNKSENVYKESFDLTLTEVNLSHKVIISLSFLQMNELVCLINKFFKENR